MRTGTRSLECAALCSFVGWLAANTYCWARRLRLVISSSINHSIDRCVGASVYAFWSPRWLTSTPSVAEALWDSFVKLMASGRCLWSVRFLGFSATTAKIIIMQLSFSALLAWLAHKPDAFRWNICFARLLGSRSSEWISQLRTPGCSFCSRRDI